MIARLLAASIAFVWIAPSFALGDDGPAKQSLLGKWSLIGMERNGQRYESSEKDGVRVFGEFELTRNDFRVRVGESHEFRGTYTLDLTATPAAIDMTISEGPRKGEKLLGILGREGERLRLCVAPPDMPRPSKFESPAGSNHFYNIYKTPGR